MLSIVWSNVMFLKDIKKICILQKDKSYKRLKSYFRDSTAKFLILMLSMVSSLQWDLVCNRKGMNKATATIFFIGVMLGAPLFGFLSDR